jgi:hypothetical protein
MTTCGITYQTDNMLSILLKKYNSDVLFINLKKNIQTLLGFGFLA